MRTKIGLIAFSALVTGATLGWRTVPTAQEAGIQGAWTINSEDGGYQRGLYIFTESHYSIMRVRGGQERAVAAGETATDAEIIEAYNTFTANSGRYTLEGDQLTSQAYMAKAPYYMVGFPDNSTTRTVTVDGDTMTWTNANGDTLTLTRRE